ncbi:hypothetical protein DPEC_G00030490 [Dallia pectoralis]|uniref:Uncharacterized protein n=1 Tax=Dallia pectoralis TaxID=75939 RepID=A0ACC2HCT5_DALPE|nr:hypothetical protein DPEC_G00030490 [Dallia pectoralis]
MLTDSTVNTTTSPYLKEPVSSESLQGPWHQYPSYWRGPKVKQSETCVPHKYPPIGQSSGRGNSLLMAGMFSLWAGIKPTLPRVEVVTGPNQNTQLQGCFSKSDKAAVLWMELVTNRQRGPL